MLEGIFLNGIPMSSVDKQLCYVFMLFKLAFCVISIVYMCQAFLTSCVSVLIHEPEEKQ